MTNFFPYLSIEIQRILDWTQKKIAIHASNRTIYFSEREVWWASLGQNIGSEVNGKNFHFERPIIVLKKLSGDMLLAIPCTTKQKNGSWYHPFSIGGEGRKAIIGQLRTISSKRLIRKLGRLTQMHFQELIEALVNFIKTNPPTQVGGFSDPANRRTM